MPAISIFKISKVPICKFQITNFQISKFPISQLPISKFPISKSSFFKQPISQIANARFFKFSNSQSLKFPNSKFQFSKFQIPRYQTVRCTGLPAFSEIQILRYGKTIFSRMLPSFSCILKYFGDNYVVRGSRFGHIFGRSKNV